MSTRSNRRSTRLRCQKNIISSEGTVNETSNQLILIGSKVRKKFMIDDSNAEWFNGEVTQHDKDSGFYSILYDDGDEEDCTHEELQEILVANKTSDCDEEYRDQSSDDEDDSSFEDCVAARNWKAAPVVTPSPTVTPSPSVTRQQTPKVKRKYVPKVLFKEPIPKTKPNPNTIAIRGLPRGALAKCLETGLTIRSVDGILPIIPTSPFLHATASPKKNTATPDTPLPGKILVTSRDGNGYCPPGIVGLTFTVADLYKALPKAHRSKFDINYTMEVVADPTFASWEFVNARISSSGLLEFQDGPKIIVIGLSWEGNARVTGWVSWYREFIDTRDKKGDMLWAIIEATERDNPSVLLGAPPELIDHPERKQEIEDSQYAAGADDEDEDDLLPLPRSRLARVRISASLLQKAIRRGGLCSTAPLLEACTALLSPTSPAGSTFAMLKTVWECMLVDASPFNDADDCLGLPGFLLLSLVAKANPNWNMPTSLCRAAVAGALRAAKSAPSQPWLGFFERIDTWWILEQQPVPTNKDLRARDLRNILRTAQAAIGGRIAWGKWNSFQGDQSAAALLSYINVSWNGSFLPPAPAPITEVSSALSVWEACTEMLPARLVEPRFLHLDDECRWSAIEPSVMPSTLVLLQALLSRPPTKWQKHSLPSLSKQIRKLISEANPRHKERVQLARLSTWGTTPGVTNRKETGSNIDEHAKHASHASQTSYTSYRDVVTSSSVLSEQETEVIDCFEAIQKWMTERLKQEQTGYGVQALAAPSVQSTPNEETFIQYNQVNTGAPLTAMDGRIGFLLAFAGSVELEICPDPQLHTWKEVVSLMFCGDQDDPLLVQRIGRARSQGKEAATVGGTTSGATAVPSLGYVQKERSREEAMLFKAAEHALADYWNGGKVFSLPLPPAGLQWNLPDDERSMGLGWEKRESTVKRTAKLVADINGNTKWEFTIAGKPIDAFDARPVMSPCSLDSNDTLHRPIALDSRLDSGRLLRIAFYDDSDKLPHGDPVLKAMARLHSFAKADRKAGLSEGRVFDWFPLANASLLPSRTWRDALLAIRTRERNHVVLGKGISSDGTGTPLDLSEGVLVRMFHGFEFLYPQVIYKEAALKFRVRPRGAAYYHLLASLEMLGRGEAQQVTKVKRKMSQYSSAPKNDSKRPRKMSQYSSAPKNNSKRPRRNAAVASSEKTAALLKDDFPNFPDFPDQHVSEISTEEAEDVLLLPKIRTSLWAHQEASVTKVVEGVMKGKRGHADASAVGAGKTLTALATIARLAKWVQESGRSRHGVLVMLPTKALIREWLLEIATHTHGFHVIEQREDGSLFSLTYGKSHPPIDGNSLVISTLDRVCKHPFVRQVAWDFVVIDECLSVQNAAAKRTPSAWRQIEVSMCGVLMLSATFFRSKYEQLFYMIRMLRSPLPRSIEWLPATIHEHIVCQIPETDRRWQLKGEMVPLAPNDLRQYRGIIDAFRRKQINEPGKADGRKLWVDLESFLRSKYEGRGHKAAYEQASPMGDAFAKAAKGLLQKGRRPLVFADTSQEADFLVRALRKKGFDACTWASIASKQISDATISKGRSSKTIIVAVKTVEGQGINMQGYADAILCRPTPGDHLEQMKGRIDRPGQSRKDLLLVVLVAEHTIEEAKFANIRLAGNFFREYIAPVATRYRERIDLQATLAAGGTKNLKSGTVSGEWKRQLEAEGSSGAFADTDYSASTNTTVTTNENTTLDTEMIDPDFDPGKKSKAKKGKGHEEPKYKPLNKVLRNKGDPRAIRQAKALAKDGKASIAVQGWLFSRKATGTAQKKGIAKDSLLRFSDAKPPIVLDQETVYKAVAHLSNKDSKLAALIARVGPDALVRDCGSPRPPTQARLFDRCVRAITFTMVSVDAGNSFLRRLAMKIGVCIERKPPSVRNRLLNQFLMSIKEGGDSVDLNSPKQLLELLLLGQHKEFTFTHLMVRELIKECEMIKGKRSGYPHLCGVTFPCGKNDDHSVFLEKARAHVRGGDPVSTGYSAGKAGFLVALVEDFESGKVSGEKIAKASDREAAQMLIGLKGIGDWAAGQILMNFLSRADIMVYGDLTVRNFLNDLYDINHHDESETLLESAADFGDTGPNRNLIDDVAKRNGWAPYRSVVVYLMYHLQEENLVLL